jgi:hypothetical protein
MMEYKLINNDEGNASTIKCTNDNGKVKFIPVANENTDYQVYLEWLAEGNTPEEAE